MSYCDGKLEEGHRTVRIEGAGLGPDALRKLSAWMMSTAAWIERMQAKEDGGYRWVLRRGTEPTACYMAGIRRTTPVVPLVPVTVRARSGRRGPRPWHCFSCDAEIPAGTHAWRQKPGSCAGHSHARFCAACVDRGGPPPIPTLTIVDGEAAEGIPTPRGSLAVAPEEGAE